jgi:hypothetical protein
MQRVVKVQERTWQMSMIHTCEGCQKIGGWGPHERRNDETEEKAWLV